MVLVVQVNTNNYFLCWFFFHPFHLPFPSSFFLFLHFSFHCSFLPPSLNLSLPPPSLPLFLLSFFLPSFPSLSSLVHDFAFFISDEEVGLRNPAFTICAGLTHTAQFLELLAYFFDVILPKKLSYRLVETLFTRIATRRQRKSRQ